MDKKPYFNNIWDLNFDKSYMTKSNQERAWRDKCVAMSGLSPAKLSGRPG